jgi:hypothetical protein
MRAEGGPVFGNALQHLYEAAKANGEVDDALAYAMELVSLLEENDQDDLVADTLEEMGNLCLLNEKDEMGNDFLERATNIRKALGQQPE